MRQNSWLGLTLALVLFGIGGFCAGLVFGYFHIALDDEPKRSIIRTVGMLPGFVVLGVVLRSALSQRAKVRNGLR